MQKRRDWNEDMVRLPFMAFDLYGIIPPIYAGGWNGACVAMGCREGMSS